MLSPDRIPDSARLRRRRRRLRRRAPRHRAYLASNWRTQPEIEAIAEAAGVSADRAASSVPPLGRAHPEGLPAGAHPRPRARAAARTPPACSMPPTRSACPGPGRLHDLFVTHEAMSPGEWKSGGEGLTIVLRLSPLAVRHRAGDGDRARTRRARLRGSRARRRAALADMQARWPQGQLSSRTPPRTAPLARAHLRSSAAGAPSEPLRVVLIGTDFEVRVWETLLKMPVGRAHHLFRHRRQGPRAQGGARGRRRGRQEPDLLRGAVPPRARQERRPHRLSLGPHPQARHAGLGAGAAQRSAPRRRDVQAASLSRGLRHVEGRRRGAGEIALAIGRERFRVLPVHEIGQLGVGHAAHLGQAADSRAQTI